MKHRSDSLAGFPVIIELPVLWGDEDAFGHVNNVIYLKWCETARVEYLARVGLWPVTPPEKAGPILASISCDFRCPVNYPDKVHVGARVTHIGNRSFRMEHVIVSEALDTVVAEADSTLVTIDYARNKTIPVPEACRKSIEKLEGRSLSHDGGAAR